MSLIEEFEDLNHFAQYMVENIEYDVEKGFGILGAFPGMTFDEVMPLFGEPKHKLFDRDEQQTAEYFIPIACGDDPQRFRVIRVLLWAFHRNPIYIFEFKVIYRRDDTYKPFLKYLFENLVEKFGEPGKKTLRNRREDIFFEVNGSKISVMGRNDATRIQLTLEH